MSQLKRVVLKESWGKYQVGEEVLVDSARAATLIEAKMAVAGRKKRARRRGKGEDFVVSSGAPTLRVLEGGK